MDNDKFYMLLLKGGYIKFHKKLGYTSFTTLFKPYLFKIADRTYIRLGTLKIIGAWVIGIDAELLIGELVTAIQNSLDIRIVAGLSNQHPTSSEGIAKAARKLLWYLKSQLDVIIY